ncbi:MAG TPA: hypothetical protein ENJ39_05885 [Flammeovirgaceae bacterium]|nr:hypothetical protein [Flammeovirgaceae bacterium]
MKHWLFKHVMILVGGMLLGGLAGYAYWYYVGCYSGTCLITSRPLNSSLYGMLMGALLAANLWDYLKNKVEHKS